MLSELMADLRYRLRALLRRNEVEKELAAEVEFHLEQETRKYLRAGLSPEQARRQARLAFGGVERFKEESREGRGVRALESAAADFRSALRGIRTDPGFALAVILTLALGIGANAAMFGIVDRLLFRPPAYLTDPGATHRVYLASTNRGRERVGGAFEYTRYLDFLRWTRTVEKAAAFGATRLAIGSGLDVREMPVQPVSASYFDFFDARPVIGRFFTTREDTVPRGAAVVVLGYGFWQTRYGGRPDALGQSLQIGPAIYTVIGVAPKGMGGIELREQPVGFIPITTYAGSVDFLGDNTSYYQDYHWGWLGMIVRRKPGVDLAAATADFTGAYLRSWAAEKALGPLPPVEVAKPHVVLASTLPERGPNQTTTAKVAQWLGGVAAIVLLIACANVANLLLARSLRRRKEIALRIALGVSRGRLFRQLLTESLLLAIIGGAAGLAVAHFGGVILRALFLPASEAGHSVVDWRLVGFTAAVTVAAGVLTGLAPLIQARRSDVAETLKAGVREGAYQRSRLRTGLLLLQGTLSVVLLIGAGLFVRSLEKVRSLRLGYDVDPVLYLELHSRGMKATDEQRAALSRRLEEAARNLPGVEAASRAATVPFWSRWSTGLYVPGIDSVQRLGRFTLQTGSPQFFRTMGTRIVQGRGITEQDRAGTPRVIVVSDAMAQLIWPGKDPLGQCIRVEADSLPCSTVVGVAENIKQTGLTDDPGLHYYLAADQFHPESAHLFIRVQGEAAAVRESIRLELQKLMPGSSYLTATPFREIVDPQLESWKLGATLFLAFGGMALLVAAIGLYSVIAYNVAQRTHELGVRIALGAAVGDVLRMVLGQGLAYAAAGVLIGAGVALLAGRWLEPLLFAQSARDPIVFGAVALVLLGTAVAASLVPARRAARVDPSITLRAD
jgi:predicted permease